jgi:hypothetical protein
LPLLPDKFDQHPLPPPAVELTVKDLLPGTRVEPAVGHCHHHLAAHDLALQVRVGVVLARPVVLVLADGGMRGQPLQPLFIVLMQAILIVIDGPDPKKLDQEVL